LRKIRLKFRKKKQNLSEPKATPLFDFPFFAGSSPSAVRSYHELKARLVEQYQHSPEFHTFVNSFYHYVQSGQATFDGLFGALLVAKDLFVQEHENLREPKEK